MNWLTSRWTPVVALATLALTSCDTGTALNVDLPDTASVNTLYKDFDVVAGTVRLTPVQTQKTDHFLIGRLADNVAGTTTARAYFNVVDAGGIAAVGGTVTDSLPGTFASGSTRLDSVVLVMGFDRVNGSSTTPAKFDVYKLADPLDERQVYNSSTVTPLVPADKLGEGLTSSLNRTQQQVVTAAVPATLTTPAVPAVTTTVPDQTVRLLMQRTPVPPRSGKPAVSEIPLPFATNLFGQMQQSGFAQPQLDAALKGLAVLPNAAHNSSIVSFSKGYKSRMVFYFHAADTLRRVYSVYFGPAYSALGYATSRDPRYYTQITNDLPPALADLANQPGFVDPTRLGGTSYVQEGTGLGTRVTFTGLADLMAKAQSGSLTVNRAELRVPVKPYSNVLYPNPSQLYAVEVDGVNNIIPRLINYIPTNRIVQADGFNQLGSGSPAVGALTDNATAQPYYSLPMTSYLDAYLKNRLDGNPVSLVLVPNILASTTLSLNRAALDASQIKLRVYYSNR